MTPSHESDVDVLLIQRVIFAPEISDERYRQMRSRMSLLDHWRFRRAGRFLTRLARKLETDADRMQRWHKQDRCWHCGSPDHYSEGCPNPRYGR